MTAEVADAAFKVRVVLSQAFESSFDPSADPVPILNATHLLVGDLFSVVNGGFLPAFTAFTALTAGFFPSPLSPVLFIVIY
jgi:hypothetical protein